MGVSLSRILLVDDTSAEWKLALSSPGDDALIEQITLVKDEDEALNFLYERGPFERRIPGLPAVVVLGAKLRRSAAMALLKSIRGDAALRRVPVVVCEASSDQRTARSAYDHRANSLVCTHGDVRIRAGQYAALTRFWGRINEPPPGSMPRADRRRNGS